MIPPFQIRTQWPEAPVDGEPDLAHLSIWAGEVALTRLAEIEKGDNRDFFRASAVSLAFWVADNWWRLRYEPLPIGRPTADWRLKHELSSISGGTLWPPLMIYGTGQRVTLSPAYGARLAAGPVRYLELDTAISVDGAAFDKGVDGFLGKVQEVCRRARDGEALHQTISQLFEERADDGASAWRRLEARLGFDVDQAPDDLMQRLSGLEDAIGEPGVEEAAVAAPGKDAGEVLEAVIAATKASEAEVSLAATEEVDPAVFQSRIPWRMGEEAARWARRVMGVNDGPFSNDKIARLAGQSWEKLEAAEPTARTMPYAARLNSGESSARLALGSHAPVDRRFELARMLADAMWAPKQPFGVVSRSRTDRQKFQRAFTHGLLLPFRELRDYVDFDDPRDEQIEAAAAAYSVRASVVKSALIVKGVLPGESVFDRLEAA